MLSFYDASVAVGRPRNQALFQPLAMPADLQAHLSSRGLAGALVWHWAQQDGHPETANPLLEPFRQGVANVSICWAILPPVTAEQPELLARLAQERIAAVRLFPQAHRYPMNRVAWAGLLDELSARRLPVVLSLEAGCSWDQVYALLADYPQLTCILADIGTWSMDRFTYPLLERYPNVYVETGMLSITDGGVETMAARFGAGRLVFGTGFPKRYAEAAMLQLAQADLAEADRQAIAAGNLQRLIGGVSR